MTSKQHCSRTALSLFAVCVLPGLALAAAPQAAQTQPALPATAPTQVVTASQLPSAQPSITHGATRIEWNGRLLQLSADGAPLRDVLQQVAARTGMRVLGNAPDDPIFGNYGPASLADVVVQLVEGLSTNVIFADRSGSRPPELTLTARNGGVTPPSNDAQQATQPVYRLPQNAYQPPPQNGPTQGQPPAGPPNPGGNAGAGSNAAGTDAATTPDANGVPTSPNGVKTPQEIFEQLQRLRATRPPQ